MSRWSPSIALAASPFGVVGERHRLEIGRIDARGLLESLLGLLQMLADLAVERSRKISGSGIG